MSELKNFNKKVILASSSPRRKKILQEMGIDFEIIPSDYEEVLDNFDFTYEKIEELAYNKAKDVFNKLNSSSFTLDASIILSADTVVVLEDKILCKPEDRQDAISMLKQLSGKKHSVVTSICIINPAKAEKHVLSTTSYIEFECLSEELILNYIEEFNPLDKAGSYGIQELPEGFVKGIEGSFYNIIGLCPNALNEILKELIE